MSDYDQLVRDCVEIANQETKSLQPTVMHGAWISDNDGYGSDGIAPAVPIQAIVVKRQKMVKRADGSEELSKTVIYILGPIAPNGAPGRVEPIDLRDVFTLPDGTTGPILAIEGIVDPTTSFPFLYEVDLG